MAKSQWQIVTQGGLQARDPLFKAHKVKSKVLQIDLNLKRKRPNGQMMTDVEWATLRMSVQRGTRALSTCRCHGACECFAKKPDDITAAVKAAEATKRPFEVVTQYGKTRIKFLDITEEDMVESSVPSPSLHDLRKRSK